MVNATKRRQSRLVFVALLVTNVSCSSETSILLHVEGDVRPGVDADLLTIGTLVDGGAHSLTPHTLTSQLGLPQSLKILAGETVNEAVEVL